MRRLAGRSVRWIGPPAVALALAWPSSGQHIADYPLFARTGTSLLHGHLAEVYADPTNQAGPLELALFGGVHLLDAVRPGLGQLLLPSAGAALVAVLLLAGARRLRVAAGLAPAPVLQTGVVLLAALWGLCQGPLLAGHPAELVIPVLWLLAGAVARRAAGRRRRLPAAGVLVGVAAAIEPWGILGLPVLLLAPPGPERRRALVAAPAAAAAAYLPFLATGSFALPRYRWIVGDGSLVHVVAPHLDGFPWTLRLVQATLALAAGAAAARALRGTRERSLEAVWIVPLVTAGTRLALDPAGADYYWWAPLLLALAGLALARGEAPLPSLAAGALACWNAVDPGREPAGTALVTLPLAGLAVLAAAKGPSAHDDDAAAASATRSIAGTSSAWYARSLSSMPSRKVR